MSSINIKSRRLNMKEIVLVTVLLCLIASYFIVNSIILPKYNEFKKISENLVTSEQRLRKLQAECKNEDKLDEEIEKLQYQITRLKEEIPPYISQEKIVLSLAEYINFSGINIAAISFYDNNMIKADSYVSNIENVDKNNNELQIDSTSPIVLTQNIAIKFSGEPFSLYKFIYRLENNLGKAFVRKMSLNNEEEELSGIIDVEYVAYKDWTDNEDFILNVPILDGKTTPFTIYDKQRDDEFLKDILDNIDFHMAVNNSNGEDLSIIMGEYNRRETEIYYKGNNEVNAKLIIDKINDKFKYTYFLEENSKTSEKVLMVKDSINMEVLSCPRVSDLDKASIIFDVENNTDTILEITVINDDIENPRFKIGKKSGNVNIKKVNE